MSCNESGNYKGQCCCECENHHTYYSHPWVNGLSITHQLGWVCHTYNPSEGHYVVVSRGHGHCEYFTQRKELKK